MNEKRSFYKNMIRNLPPVKALELLEQMLLPDHEHNAILWLDIKKKTIDEASDSLHTSSDTLKRRHKRALDNIVATLESN